jgi:hypothetical protein
LPAFSLAGRPLRGDERSRAEDDGVPVEDMGDFFKPFLVLSGTRDGGAFAACGMWHTSKFRAHSLSSLSFDSSSSHRVQTAEPIHTYGRRLFHECF